MSAAAAGRREASVARAARLIVVLERPRETLALRRLGVEIGANIARRRTVQPVEQPLVVGVVKSLLLQGPFEIPGTPPRETTFRRMQGITVGQNSSVRRGQPSRRIPRHVRSKTSLSTSMAMSQRTPSQCAATTWSCSAMARRVSALK